MPRQKQISIPTEVIENKIYLIRGQKVMLDRDLAKLYGVQTRDLNKVVRRNIDRFPEDFMFQLSNEEFTNLKFQFGTSRWGGTRKLLFVFTEQGVSMLSAGGFKALEHTNIFVQSLFVSILIVIMTHKVNNGKNYLYCQLIKSKKIPYALLHKLDRLRRYTTQANA